jgi:aldehyde dehydrogenase (NAD+)
MPEYPAGLLLINGELRVAASGASYAVHSPWTGEQIGTASNAGKDDLAEAIAAARRAFDDTDWSVNTTLRKSVLGRYAAALKANRDRIAALARDEVGSAGFGIMGPQCDIPLGMLDGVLGLLDTYQWERDIGVGETFGVRSRRIVRREATGVVGAITPWNVPLQINLAKIMPALAAGCTVILKPAPETPLIGALLGELAVEAGVPPGVLNVLTGADAVTLGEGLVSDPRVDLISFTGSSAVGKRIMAQGAPSLKRVFLELGGKSASILLDDIDVAAQAANALMVLFHAGQGCAHLTRLLVPRAKYDVAVEVLKGGFENVPYGDYEDPSQLMGPLISERQRQRVLDYIEIGKAEGARLVCGGGIPKNRPKGYFVQPTLFADVNNTMRIAREEIFGPVLVVIAHDGDDDAIRIANDSDYGLSGSVTSSSFERAMQVARRVRTGTMSVNGGVWYGADAPFGGYKHSGIGREMGIEGFEEYLEIKTIAVPA